MRRPRGLDLLEAISASLHSPSVTFEASKFSQPLVCMSVIYIPETSRSHDHDGSYRRLRPSRSTIGFVGI
jgi:hypothetical protein